MILRRSSLKRASRSHAKTGFPMVQRLIFLALLGNFGATNMRFLFLAIGVSVGEQGRVFGDLTHDFSFSVKEGLLL